MRTSVFATLCFIAAYVVVCLSMPGCGGGNKTNITQPQPGTAAENVPAPGAIPLEDATAGIEAAAVPKGVDAGLWRELTAELVRVLEERGISKLALTPPTGERNSVTDLHFDPGASGTVLAWTHVCVGDYNCDGLVSINDLTTIGQNWQAVIGDYSWSVAQLADGNADGLVSINDITPIGQNYLVSTATYNVYGSTDIADYPVSHDAPNGDGVRLAGSADFMGTTAGHGGRALFSLTVSSPEEGEHYWVRPHDGETDGSPSNATSSNLRGDWWMLGREPTHNGRSLFFGPRSNNVAWTYATGDEIFTALAVRADGWVYIGSDDDSLHAINAQGGGEWTFPTGDDVQGSPAIGADGTVYFGSWDGNFYAVNPDGSLRWDHTTDGSAWFCPAIGPDGTIYVGCNDDHLYAIRPDETVAWSYPTGAGIHACPTVGPDGAVYFGSYDGNVYAVDSDGSERWTFATGDNVTASVVLAADGTAYTGSWDGILYAIGPDGNESWRYDTGGRVSAAPAIGADGTVYVSSGSYYLYALNPDGSLRWRFRTEYSVRTSPAIGADGIIYIGDRDGVVYAVNQDGSQHWRYETGGEIGMGLAIGADGTLYAGSEDGNLYAFGGGEDGTAATIIDVQPHEGAQGSELAFSAFAGGTPPIEYTWDFGGGAAPGTSNAATPTAILGDPGFYTASVTVQNGYGPADTREFDLYVHDTAGPTNGWIHSWGGDDDDWLNDIAVDSAGHIHVVGGTRSYGAGSRDVLLLEYDPAGVLISARTWGGEDSDSGRAIAIDESDNMYIAGSYDSGQDDTLLLRFDADGELVWSKTWHNGHTDRASAIAVGSDGTVYLGGRTYGAGTGPYGALFLTYGADGVFQSAAVWDSDGHEEISDIVVDSTGDLYVVGDVYNSDEGIEDVIIFRISSTGDLEWVRTFTGDRYEDRPSVVVDAADNAYITGFSNLVLKYNSAGVLQWARTWVGDYLVLGASIAVQGSNLIVAGGVVVDDNLNPAIFLGDTDGGIAWGRQFITAYDDDLMLGIAMASLDSVYFAGAGPSSLGTWQDIAVTSVEATGTSEVPVGVDDHLTGTASDVVGVLADVTGTEDTGGGDEDGTVFRLDLNE